MHVKLSSLWSNKKQLSSLIFFPPLNRYKNRIIISVMARLWLRSKWIWNLVAQLHSLKQGVNPLYPPSAGLRSFFQAAVVSILLYGCTTWMLAITQECCEQYWTSPSGNTPQSTNYTATYLPSRKLSKLDERDMQDTAGEAGTSS